MKHVNDEFWQKFGPDVLALRARPRQARVPHVRRGLRHHEELHVALHDAEPDAGRARLPVPGRGAGLRGRRQARRRAARASSRTTTGTPTPTRTSTSCRRSSGTTTWAGSASSSRGPTPARRTPSWSPATSSRTSSCTSRAATRSSTTATSRASPAPAATRSRARRCSRARSPTTSTTTCSARRPRTRRTTSCPAIRSTRRSPGSTRSTERHKALRNGAHQHRYAEPGGTTGVYAFSRIDRRQQREYVVALNNAETAKTAAIPTYAGRRWFKRIYGEGGAWLRTNRDRGADGRPCRRSPRWSTSSTGGSRARTARRGSTSPRPRPPRPRTAAWRSAADVGGDSFYEVTFQVRKRPGWTSIGTDDTAPYRVFHDVSGLRAGTRLQYRAIVLDNRGHTRKSRARSARVPAPALTWDTTAPVAAEGSKQRDEVLLRLFADPERATHVVYVRAQRRRRPVDGDRDRLLLARLPAPRRHRRARPRGRRSPTGPSLAEPDGTRVTSAVRTIEVAGAAGSTRRPCATGARTATTRPGACTCGATRWIPRCSRRSRGTSRGRVTRVEDGWGVYEIPLVDDTQAGELHHAPAVRGLRADTREPGGDRSFVPLQIADVWLKAGDTTIYTSQPATP